MALDSALAAFSSLIQNSQSFAGTMISALGKNGQYLNVVPSQGLVVVRMGNAPGTGAEVPVAFNNDIWLKINELACEPSSVLENRSSLNQLHLFPNPTQGKVQLKGPNPTLPFTVTVYDALAGEVLSCEDCLELELGRLGSGVYMVIVRQDDKVWTGRVLKP